MATAVKPPARKIIKAGKPAAGALKSGTAVAATRGEIRREAMLAAARDIFLEHGFSNTSIEDVVGRTGGSKASLYSYFGSKEGLFGEMVSAGCKDFLRNVAIPTAVEGTLQKTLRAFGLRFFKLYTEPGRVKLMRAVIAEATRFPEFAQQLYREGPQQVRIGLAAFIKQCHADGLLNAPNPDLAAIQFITLVKGHCQFRSLFGLSPLALPISQETFIDEAVRIFLNGCIAPTQPQKTEPPMKRTLVAALLLAAGNAQALGLREIALAALHHDPRFAESSARIEGAKYGAAVADAGDKFTLGLAADVGRSDLRTDARFPQSGYRTPNSLAIAASQPLYNGGRSNAERDAAAFTLDAATQHRRDIGGKIILAALTATLDLKRDRETLKLAEASRSTLDAARGDVDKRYQAGEATKTDLAQADARRAEATANVRRAEAQLRASEIRLQRLTGPLPANAADVAWPELLPTAKTREEAIEQSHRAPAVVAATHEQRAAKAAIRIAEAAARPQISLDAHAATQDNTEFGYDRLSTWAVQLKLNVPILTGGLTAARRGEAVARADTAAANAEDEAAAYSEAAAQDWELLRASEDVIAATRVQVTAAESALDGVQKELKVGSRTTLDLLDAERELLAAQVNLVGALRDRGVTAFSLLAASGILELYNVPE